MKTNSIWPKFSNTEIKEIISVIKSGKVNYWTGSKGKLFEKEFSNYHKIKYCTSVANGTLALDLAIKSLKLPKNSKVLVTPRSFIASASIVINNGLIPIFCDIDFNSQNISANEIEKKFDKNVKALILVHLGGYPAQMDEIMNVIKKRKIYLIEDCSQAHGAKYKNKFVGTFGHLSTWSFCQDKIITTLGEGGMVATNELKFDNFIKRYRDHGKNFKKLNLKKNDNNSFKYIHDFEGSNYRMTEVQSVAGIIQLKNLNYSLKIRNKFAERYINNLKNCSQIIFPLKSEKIYHAYYKLYFYLKTENLRITRDDFILSLREMNVECFSGACPEIYLEKSFAKFQPIKRLKVAKKIGNISVMLLVDPTQNLKKIDLNSKKILRLIKDNVK